MYDSGYTTHRKACKKRAKKTTEKSRFCGFYSKGHRSLKSRTDEGDCTNAVLRDVGQHNASPTTWNDADNVEYHEPPMFLDADDPEHVDPVFQVDDIECEYHPSSGITPEVHAFNEFKCCPTTLESSAPPDKHPWALFKLCASQQEKFTFENHKDIHERWYTVSHRTTQRFSKFDGKTFVCFIDEPFTADTFWNIQSQLPLGSKPLAFILYADKTKLSSFGTARGYPVVAHLANLPADIHNEQVKEDRDHTSKPSWVNCKNAAEVTAEEKEEKLKEYGLRDVIVYFSIKIIVGLGQVKVAQMNKNYEAFPHWQNLKHLTQVMDISFADGSVYKDISKMVIHATHAILMKDDFHLATSYYVAFTSFLKLMHMQHLKFT
ncbi:hypothetical protein BDR07DRAFT_1380682 [Suillus spraguei]|nr:hypothetical protein BDR07DRAFT_1383296 [Suillus spraguei]KAG2356624.1 hypothetical protein BDR07DRAFT_1380682 [Suillus spraguei]